MSTNLTRLPERIVSFHQVRQPRLILAAPIVDVETDGESFDARRLVSPRKGEELKSLRATQTMPEGWVTVEGGAMDSFP
jgi:hypothetical protein